MNKKIFNEEEIQKFVHAVKIGGLRKDAKVNAFEILEMNDGDDILEKYDTLTKTAQKDFRVAARNSAKEYEEDDSAYSLKYFNEFIKE